MTECTDGYRLTYNSVTAQLSKKNTRFQYKLIKSGGRASEIENAIEWLVLSGIVIRVNALDTIKKPLDNYKNIDSFKIFVSDAGLTENYVCAQLVMRGYECYTWYSEGEAEMDFVNHQDSKAKSLGIYVNKFKPFFFISNSS